MEVQGLQASYSVCGAGDPILLLHGWGCNKEIFARLQQELSDSYRVYSLDFPGFGESTPPEEVWGVDAYTSFVETFVSQLGLQKPVMVGHSFGGRVCILYASRNENVKKVILVDAAGLKPKRSLSYYTKVYSYKLSKKVLNLCLGKERAAALLERMVSKGGSSDYGAAKGIMRPILSRVVNEDLKSVMPNINVPTLLMWGTEDTATPLRDAQTMERLIPNAGLVEFKGVGHYSFLERPVETQLIIRNFLQS